MRALLTFLLCCLFSSYTYSQVPAITGGDIAHGSLGGTYVATASGTNFFAAEVISQTNSRQIKVKKYDASGIITETIIYMDRCETCKTTGNLPLAIFPTSDGGAIVYYQATDNTSILKKITPDGKATWTTNYSNLKFINASPTSANSIYVVFQVISGSNANSYFIYNVDVDGITDWTKNLLTVVPKDFAATPDAGIVITDADSTKRFDKLGKKLWAVKRGSNLLRIADSNFGYQADGNRLIRFSLNTGNIDFVRNQADINQLLITSDKGVIFSTDTEIQKITTANTSPWVANVGSQRLTLSPNGNIGSVGAGVNANKLTVYNANGNAVWEKTMTYNLGNTLFLHAAADNSWYVTTRGQVSGKPSSHGIGFLYRLASANSLCDYTVSITPSTKQSICKTGGSITFEISQPKLDLSYGFPSRDYEIQWLKNNAVVASNTLSYANSTPGKYAARIIQGSCVKTSVEVEIDILGNTAPSITADFAELCLGGGASVKLTATGCPANSSISWSDNQVGASVNVSPTATTDYSAKCVQMYLQNGAARTCISDAGNTQKVTILPTSNLTIPNGIISANAVCKGTSEQLTFQITGTPLSPLTYAWTKDNASVSTQSTYSATDGGNYQISIKDKRGCTAQSAVKELKLLGTKIPTVTSNLAEICVNGGVSPVINVTGCTSSAILWNTGAETPSIRVSPTVTTNYSARCVDTFTAANGAANTCQGASSVAKTLKVLQQSDIVITSLFSRNIFCKNDVQDTIRTEVRNFTNPLAFEWFRDGSFISKDLEIVVSDGGNYQLKVKDGRGCTQESVVKTIERSDLTVKVTGDRAFCDGTNTQLQATGSNGIGSTTFEWKLDGRAFSTNPTVTVLNPGNYVVRGTDNKGCREEVSVPVELYPKIVAGYDRTATIKGNLFYNFDETKLLKGTRPFNVALSAVSERNEPITISGNTIGKFTKNSTVFIRATDANSCTFKDSIQIKYVPCNVAVSIAGDTSFCYYNKVSLQSQGQGVKPFTYTWSIGGSQFPNESGSTISTGAAGIYRTTLTDSAKCEVTSNPFSIKDKGRDIVAFIRANGDSVAYRPFGVDINAAVQPQVVYQWFRNDTLLVNEVTPAMYATQTGKYMIRVSKDGCFNNSNTINITILTPLAVEKNEFSGEVTAFPNPTDEQFIIRSQTLIPQKATCRITDTQGKILFEAVAEVASTENEWKVNASRWAAGVYIYHISTAKGEASGKIIKR